MNTIQALIRRLNALQQRYRLPAFIYAVIKKYGDDQAGYQAALLTYYAFLSLFPLLLVLTTVTGIIAGSHPALQHSILKATTSYFPVFGSQLSDHVQGIHKTGMALIVGVLFTLYGARGVADAFRNGVNHIWRVPMVQRDGFPRSVLKSLLIIVIGGAGLIVAAICVGLAAAAGHGLIFRLLSLLVNVAILFGLFSWLLNVSLPSGAIGHIPLRDIRSGALTAAIGLVLLQTFGGLLLARELKSLDAVYSYFAIALGLLFWIYLQAQVLYYAIEVAVVHRERLWPRSLVADELTEADKRAYAGQAKKERATTQEAVHARFRSKRRR